jgi:hypothetical protein
LRLNQRDMRDPRSRIALASEGTSMRRLLISITAVMLLLAFASPAAAARPIKQSGTWEQASAFSSSCTQQGGNSLCTDVYVDAFAFDDEFSDVCVGMFTYSISPSGRFRFVSDANGCGAANGFAVADDGTWASLAPSDVQLYSCNARTCTEGDLVTVAADWVAIGDPSTYSGRATYTDGACTYRQSWDGVQSQATSSFSVGGVAYEGDGYILREEFTVTERCR